MTICHIICTRRSSLQLPEVGQNIWQKQVGTLYGEYNIVQLNGVKICLYGRYVNYYSTVKS